MIFGDIYLRVEFKNPDTSINTVLQEEGDEGHIRPNADLKSGP